ncbi:hypothetical protein AAU61_01085 [Desulfocarbo indianensis]|nr:hypothetical protein AAU61_01085 [Desulfocarbo indianensis]
MAQLYLLILLAIVILAVQAIQVWLAMLAFNIDLETSLGIEVVICVILFTTIGAAVPSSPGYIGTFHLSVTMALSLFKVPEASALSFAIVLHIISVVCIISTGLIGMFYFKSTEEVYKAFSKNDVG